MADRFIIYSSLDDLQDTRKRAKINRYVNSTRKEYKARTGKKYVKPPLPWGSRSSKSSSVEIGPELQRERAARQYEVEPGSDTEREADSSKPSMPRKLFGPLTPVAGNRRDPFASYPVTQSEQTLWAVDYYTQIYAKDNATLYTDENGNWLFRHLFSLALQSDMLFEAVILSMSRLHPAGQTEIVLPLVNFERRRSSVISKLHRTFVDGVRTTEDTTILTITALISADFFAGRDEHVETHLNGLRAIVSARGGLEKGGFDRFTAYNIAGTYALGQFASQRFEQSSRPPSRPEVVLVYPRHPFPPRLCAVISSLPLGFGEIALSGRISVRIIELLARYAQAAQGSRETKETSLAEINEMVLEFLNYVNHGTTTPLERDICLLCFMFNDRGGLQWKRGKGQRVYGKFLENLKEVLRTMAETFMDSEGCTLDFATWGVAILAVVTTVEGVGLDQGQRREALARLVRRYPRDARYWDETRMRLSRFFFPDSWIDQYHVWWTTEMERLCPLSG